MYKVLDDRAWEMVKEGRVKGFSIEGYFIDKMERPNEPINDFEEEEAEEMLSYIRRIVRDDKRYKDGKKEELESYSDYPDAVKNNAQRGIDLNKEVNNKHTVIEDKNNSSEDLAENSNNLGNTYLLNKKVTTNITITVSNETDRLTKVKSSRALC